MLLGERSTRGVEDINGDRPKPIWKYIEQITIYNITDFGGEMGCWEDRESYIWPEVDTDVECEPLCLI